jgi:signal transduction histidine kinase
VKRIIRDSDRASEVIRGIRGLVRKAPPRMEPVDLNDLISRTLTLANNEMKRNQVQPQTELAADLPSVLGDRVQLQQVLLNLIMNALEAMSSISGPPLLTIKSENLQDRKSVAIAVKDSGVGLDSQEMKRIFDAFYTTKPQGMGMGLSICHNIIESHGGHLTGASNVDRGATFAFTPPAHQDTSDRVDIATA